MTAGSPPSRRGAAVDPRTAAATPGPHPGSTAVPPGPGPGRSRGTDRYLAPPRLLRAGFSALGHLLPEVAGELALRRFTRPRRHEPRRWEQELLAGAAPVELPDDPGLAAASWGDPAAAPVLLIHGWEGRGSQLGAFVRPLLERGHRVVALDAPAHGRSAGRDANPLRFARAILAAGRALGPLHGIVGHSMGGAATVIALDRGLAAERVVLLAAPAWLSRVAATFPQLLGLPPTAAASFGRRLAGHVGERPEAVDPAALLERGARTGAAWMAGGALILHDEADRDVPVAEGAALAERWPGARLERLRVGGHRRMLFDPGVVELVVGYLGGGARAERALGQGKA